MGRNEPEWAGNIVKYLDAGEHPEGKEEARKFKRRVARFVKVDEILYKRGFAAPYYDVSHCKKHICSNRNT